MTTNAGLIPEELKSRPQWAVATLKGPNPKEPINPNTERRASPTDPTTWVSFEDAYDYVQEEGGAVGYMLHESDPFVIIDIDPPQDMTQEHSAALNEVLEQFPSYTETSVSGRGVHIILTHHESFAGHRRGPFEVYSRERFMLCTGNAINGLGIRPADPEALAEFVEAVAPDPIVLHESEAEEELDDTIIEKVRKRSPYFDAPPEPDGWSEADMSLLEHIAFYTGNHDQALRIFMQSACYRPNGKGGKMPAYHYHHAYLPRTVVRAMHYRAKRAEDTTVSDVQAIEYQNLQARLLAQYKRQANPIGEEAEWPKGLLGEVAAYMYHSAPRPVKEVAIAGAINFMAGIVGRAYNISGSGLNVYTLLVARTGRGKDAAKQGSDRLASAIESSGNLAIRNHKGATYFASGQAVLKRLSDHPVSASFLGEFGETLAILNSKKPNEATQQLRRVLLDLFGRSGQGSMLDPMSYSNKEMNTEAVASPCLSFLGDTTPDGFYGNLTTSSIKSGFIPRLLVIEYEGDRPPRNQSRMLTPPPALVQKLSDLVTNVSVVMNNGQVQDIANRVLEYTQRFEDDCDLRMSACPSGSPAEDVWNRAHLIMLRLAGLYAVCVNPSAPVITKHEAKWAMAMVENSIGRILKNTETGMIYDDVDAAKAEDNAFEAVIRDYLVLDGHTRVQYRCPKRIATRDDLVPYQYVRRRLRNLNQFKTEQYPDRAVEQVVKNAIDGGRYRWVLPTELRELGLPRGTKLLARTGL